MNRAEAEQIAAAIAILRPKWLQPSLVTLLGKHQHRPARDVMLALVYVAYDPATQGPGRIATDGPWWWLNQTAGVETAVLPPRYTPPPPVVAATPDTIRALREAHPIRPKETSHE